MKLYKQLGPNPPAFRQGNFSAGDGSSSATTVAFTENVLAGSLLIVMTTVNSGTTASTPTDTLDNTYNLIPGCPVQQDVGAGTTQSIYLWYAISNSAGANTVSQSYSGNNNFYVVAAEYQSLGTPVLDASGTANVTASSITVETSEVAVGADLIVYGFLSGTSDLDTTNGLNFRFGNSAETTPIAVVYGDSSVNQTPNFIGHTAIATVSNPICGVLAAFCIEGANVVVGG